MAEPTFDRAAFNARLNTHLFGRVLIARHTVGSTNDVAWEALAAGEPDGTVVVADVQDTGRGRDGRGWHTAPGRGLAMSFYMHPGCDPASLPVLPLAVGLALKRALARLGASAELKWPNDVLLSGRKVSGILCEGRTMVEGDQAVVVGCGVNVFQTREEFPEAIRDQATSLALEGVGTDRESVAAELLNALEPLWTELEEAGPGGVIAGWTREAAFWGRTLTVRTPAGPLTGIARALGPDGALLLESSDGETVRVVAGDVTGRVSSA